MILYAQCTRRTAQQDIDVLIVVGASIIAGLVILLIRRLRLYRNTPVFQNPEVIFFKVKACFQAGRNTLQKACLVILTIPKLFDSK